MSNYIVNLKIPCLLACFLNFFFFLTFHYRNCSIRIISVCFKIIFYSIWFLMHSLVSLSLRLCIATSKIKIGRSRREVCKDPYGLAFPGKITFLFMELCCVFAFIWYFYAVFGIWIWWRKRKKLMNPNKSGTIHLCGTFLSTGPHWYRCITPGQDWDN